MLGNIGSVELFVIMVTILLVFGAKRIPEIARGLGRGIREFREATRSIKDELRLDEDVLSDRGAASRRYGAPDPRVDRRSAAHRTSSPREEATVPPASSELPKTPETSEDAGSVAS